MPESLPMKTRLLLAGASLQLISLAKKSEKKEKKQKVVTVSAGMTRPNRFDRTENFVGRLPTLMRSRRDLKNLRLLPFLYRLECAFARTVLGLRSRHWLRSRKIAIIEG